MSDRKPPHLDIQTLESRPALRFAGTREEDPPRWPRRDFFDEIVKTWQEDLAKSPEAQQFLRRRKLWDPAVLAQLQVGFAGRRRHPLPESQSLCRLIAAIGILDDRGNHQLYGRLVIPIFDEMGWFGTAYSHSLEDTSPDPHLYPSLSRYGVFHPHGIVTEGTVLVTANVLDALTLRILGFENVTSNLGETIFSPDLMRVFKERRVRRVVLLYPRTTSELVLGCTAQSLLKLGGESFWAPVAGRELNALVVDGMTRADVQVLVDQARPLESYLTWRWRTAPDERPGEAL